MIRKLLLGLAVSLVILLGVVGVRTARFTATQPEVAPVAAVPLAPGAVERFAAGLRYPTISHQDPAEFDEAAFAGFREHLRASFPLAHAQLGLELVNGHAMLYTWPGREPSLGPILLMGHYDVVPVEPGTEDGWTAPPFGGVIADGWVWGRGAIDNKPSVIGTLEAVEMLLAEGFQPRRTVLLAFGHDEEVGGLGGAARVAALLAERGVRLEMVLDEGGAIGLGLLPGVAPPTALVGIAEKGYLSVELVTRAAGGHSSMPPRQTAAGVLSAAVARVEAAPLRPRLSAATEEQLRRVGPHMPLAQRAAIANLWASRPLVVSTFTGTERTNAMVRTTTAATMLQAGTKDNVLPSQARAVINFRLLPGDSIAGVLAHVRRAVNDERVEVRPLGEFNVDPSPTSSTSSAAFSALERTVLETNPGVVITPYLVMGGTDARHFRGLSENVYRFLPARMSPEDMQGFHGTNERMRVEDYENAVRFYRRLVLNTAG